MINITIENMGKIKETFKKYPVQMAQSLRTGVYKTVFLLQKAAQEEAPVNKQTGGGNLRQSIEGRMTGSVSGVVHAKAKYAFFVHEGTRPHLIRPVKKKALANTRTGEFFGKLVHHPGTKANPFMERAVRKSEGQIQRLFTDAVKTVITNS